MQPHLKAVAKRRLMLSGVRTKHASEVLAHVREKHGIPFRLTRNYVVCIPLRYRYFSSISLALTPRPLFHSLSINTNG